MPSLLHLSYHSSTRAFGRIGAKVPQRDLVAVFEGMDRGRTGYISLQALVDRIYPKNREGGRADRGQGQGRDRGDRDVSRGSRGDDDVDDRDEGADRGRALVLKANESRVLFKKRPDLLQELLLQMRTVHKMRRYVHSSRTLPLCLCFLTSHSNQCITYVTYVPYYRLFMQSHGRGNE